MYVYEHIVPVELVGHKVGLVEMISPSKKQTLQILTCSCSSLLPNLPINSYHNRQNLSFVTLKRNFHLLSSQNVQKYGKMIVQGMN